MLSLRRIAEINSIPIITFPEPESWRLSWFRRISAMETGTPTSAVTMPAGTWTAAKAARPIRSAAPTIQRAGCGGESEMEPDSGTGDPARDVRRHKADEAQRIDRLYGGCCESHRECDEDDAHRADGETRSAAMSAPIRNAVIGRAAHAATGASRSEQSASDRSPFQPTA